LVSKVTIEFDKILINKISLQKSFANYPRGWWNIFLKFPQCQCQR